MKFWSNCLLATIIVATSNSGIVFADQEPAFQNPLTPYIGPYLVEQPIKDGLCFPENCVSLNLTRIFSNAWQIREYSLSVSERVKAIEEQANNVNTATRDLIETTRIDLITKMSSNLRKQVKESLRDELKAEIKEELLRELKN
jgi:hypothetical protein